MTPDHAKIGLPWLARLRWGLLAGQLGAVLVARELLGVDLELGRIVLFLALTAATNVLLLRQLRMNRTVSHGLCGALLAFDAVNLTALLHATGGASNPFSVLYLVHITLAAVLLGAAWTWGLTVLAVLAYGSLFLSQAHAEHLGHQYATHLRAMWLAFALTATLTAAFVVRLTAAIQRRDREIEAIREQAARSERLAALTTLAAGAAHELGTPLATIAVAAGELEREVSKLPPDHAAPLIDDARLIRGQLDRCRQILDQMTAAAGEVAGEAPVAVPLRDLIATVRAGLSRCEAERLRVRAETDGSVVAPHRALARAVLNLVRNAFDASRPDAIVDVAIAADEQASLRLTVADSGHGMSEAVLARAVEPFFTTKASGCGMGMGLFLTRTLIEQLGGRLILTSAAGVGTTVTLELPASSTRETNGHTGV